MDNKNIQPINEQDFVTKFESTFGWKPKLEASSGSLLIKGVNYDQSKRVITPPHDHS